MSVVSRVRVSVPASTSNLGPGFDCLGLALTLYNDLALELHAEPGEPVVEIKGEGETTLPRDRSNLLVKAALLALGGRAAKSRLAFKAVNRIPVARGLGSSAAAIVAGLSAANRLFGKPLLSPQDLFRYAVTLEGHPDNVAAALHGGLVVSVLQNKDYRACPLKPHKDLCAVVCVPDFELATSEARKALPQTYLREQAVGNVARALLLSSALERGEWERLGLAMEDGLHQPYRAPLVKGFWSVLQAARQAGPCGAALSGAGSSVAALCRRGPLAARIGRAMQRAFAGQGVKSRPFVLGVDRQGARVTA